MKHITIHKWSTIPFPDFIYKHFILKSLILSLLITLVLSSGYSQTPRGKFLSDSIQLGSPVRFALSFKHKPSIDIFFPDSTYNFSPFELVNREYFTTSTDQSGSLDSLIYTLVSFDVEKTQKLTLPIFIRNKQDCTAVFSPVDSVFLREMIKSNTQLSSLDLKKDTKIIALEPQPNYPLIFLIFVGLAFLSGIIFWLFGKPIRRQLKLYRFKRRYDEFLKLYLRLVKSVDDKNSKLDNVEKAVVLWKKYIERLESKPFTTFTTKEILDNLKDKRLPDALREIDATIYGGVFSTRTSTSLEVLQDMATSLYEDHRWDLVNKSLT
ncbi:hypothetical protein SAMN04515674_10336 [Pseudarcicella hirudinis]|uniref:Uncharacterized protein n=1 Tax=Pseudarcicella hirudinis TaxID=1079859 RepID=A0A1I5Q607_9BACT|nr:hypothetical protein [Pseudarcicella hirudinis]SFP41794.1 hypothetical protein SAMN04515674_10336 [Pseudarcicella hirudinis]